MAIAEEREIGLDVMENIAPKNMCDAAEDAEIAKKEYRVVNGKKGLCMEMPLTLQGVKLIYANCYSSNFPKKFSKYGFYSYQFGGKIQNSYR